MIEPEPPRPATDRRDREASPAEVAARGPASSRPAGRLRVYLGAAPGVGKTYAMLGEAQRRAERGTDVVIGIVEDHGRPRTAAMIEGLERLPMRALRHRDREFLELDVDAVLERRPEVVLVDELAHTNVPGSRNAKRWQDVEELLAAGIDVVSTVNVQHLESLNDVVERITGIAQAETIPDRVVRSAEQVELVDMTPEALRRRLVHGNVYGPDRVERALANYFRPGNLTALRELALMWLADRVDEALLSYQDAHDIDHTWEARERVVVALTGAPSGATLLRRAARVAGRARGDLLAIHVRAADGLHRPEPAELERQRALVGNVGGEYHEVVGDDPASALVQFARAERATQIVLGASARGRWDELWRGSVVNRVLRAGGDMDVHVIRSPSGEGGSVTPRTPFARSANPLHPRRVRAGWLLLLVVLPLLTAGLVALRADFGLTGDLMAYVLVVVIIAMVGGRGPGLAAAVASAMLANWYLTPPVRTWTIARAENALALLTFVVVAMAVSFLVARSERRAADSSRAHLEAEALARSAVGVALDPEPLSALLDRVRSTFGFSAAAIVSRPWGSASPSVDTVAGELPDPSVEPDLELPVGSDDVLAVWGQAPRADDRMVLGAFAAQLAAAVEQRRLRAEAVESALAAKGDALRTAILRAVSHDLRTPLASIKASISSLLQDDIDWSPEDRKEFEHTIDEETDRLDSLVGNLLDMSRLQIGALHLSIGPVGWDEIVDAAVSDVGGHGVVTVEVDEHLPPVSADPALLERATANVLANALSHGAGAEVVVRAEENDGRVVLFVVDHGPGLDAERRAQMFEPFQRLGDANPSGVGLGLAVAHGFVTAMGGTIDAVPTAGGGLTVRIGVPEAQISEASEGS